MCTERPYILKLTIFVLLAWLFMSTTVLAEEQYLCVSDEAHWFTHTGSWSTPVVNNPTDKHIISKSDNPNYAFQVSSFGQDSVQFYCISEFDTWGNIRCDKALSDALIGHNAVFEMNKIGLFYSVILSAMGNVTVVIGKCSPF